MDHRYKMVSLRHVLRFNGFLYGRAVLSSVTPAELVDEIIPETIEYQRRLKQMWIDMGIYNAVQYDFDKEFEVHYDIGNKNYYILADGKRFADIEVKRTTFFKIIYAHYYWKVLLDD